MNFFAIVDNKIQNKILHLYSTAINQIYYVLKVKEKATVKLDAQCIMHHTINWFKLVTWVIE